MIALVFLSVCVQSVGGFGTPPSLISYVHSVDPISFVTLHLMKPKSFALLGRHLKRLVEPSLTKPDSLLLALLIAPLPIE